MACYFTIEQYQALDDAMQQQGLVYAQDFGKNSNAKSFFVVTCKYQAPQKRHYYHECKMNEIADFLMQKDLHRYEVLRQDVPLHLFLDVEWPVERDADLNDATAKCDGILEQLQKYGKGHPMFKDPMVLDSSRKDKNSYHIIYPNAVFRKVDGDLKIFVLGFAQWLMKHDNSMTYMKTTKRGQKLRCVVDTAVYTKHRCFRMMGQSKASDTTMTKLVPLAGKSKVVDRTKTLVQSTDRLVCNNVNFIEALLKERASPDGIFHYYPPCDDERPKGNICHST